MQYDAHVIAYMEYQYMRKLYWHDMEYSDEE